MRIYAADSGTVGHDVHKWAVENGDNPLLEDRRLWLRRRLQLARRLDHFRLEEPGRQKQNRDARTHLVLASLPAVAIIGDFTGARAVRLPARSIEDQRGLVARLHFFPAHLRHLLLKAADSIAVVAAVRLPAMGHGPAAGRRRNFSGDVRRRGKQ